MGRVELYPFIVLPMKQMDSNWPLHLLPPESGIPLPFLVAGINSNKYPSSYKCPSSLKKPYCIQLAYRKNSKNWDP